MPAPSHIRLFHITAIANLPGICTSGALLAKNEGSARGIRYQNIAHAGAQGARARRQVPDPPGGAIHDYVPFYFAPRSPMLYAIDRGSVADCQWRQPDIVHFETTLERVVENGHPFVFYDRNATLAFSEAYTDLADLDHAIAWDILTEEPALDGFCKFWQNRSTPDRYTDRMERRQAEFLIQRRVPLSCMTRIGVLDTRKQAEVQRILHDHAVKLRVDATPAWYF
jgi:hypothetical protein